MIKIRRIRLNFNYLKNILTVDYVLISLLFIVNFKKLNSVKWLFLISLL